MRYKISDDIEIHSENSAKPTEIRARHVTDWILARPPCRRAIDYGCGKLRYSVLLRRIAEKVIAVDSEVQLARLQAIDGRRTSIRAYAARPRSRIEALDVAAFARLKAKADVAICINVLSAIPHERRRIEALSRIADHLNAQGVCLIAVQHRNSEFTRVLRQGRAKPFGDGFLIRNARGATFYGILKKEYLLGLVARSGLAPIAAYLVDQSTYVLAKRAPRNARRHA